MQEQDVNVLVAPPLRPRKGVLEAFEELVVREIVAAADAGAPFKEIHRRLRDAERRAMRCRKSKAVGEGWVV